MRILTKGSVDAGAAAGADDDDAALAQAAAAGKSPLLCTSLLVVALVAPRWASSFSLDRSAPSCARSASISSRASASCCCSADGSPPNICDVRPTTLARFALALFASEERRRRPRLLRFGTWCAALTTSPKDCVRLSFSFFCDRLCHLLPPLLPPRSSTLPRSSKSLAGGCRARISTVGNLPAAIALQQIPAKGVDSSRNKNPILAGAFEADTVVPGPRTRSGGRAFSFSVTADCADVAPTHITACQLRNTNSLYHSRHDRRGRRAGR